MIDQMADYVLSFQDVMGGKTYKFYTYGLTQAESVEKLKAEKKIYKVSEIAVVMHSHLKYIQGK